MSKCKIFLMFLLKLLGNLFLILFFCEFLIYYIVIYQCHWNELQTEPIEDGLKTMILADTHMLGPFRGHPVDKLRREWQMKRSFQTAITIFEPEVVIILGDIFDEGNWVNDKGFEEYVERFKSIFYVPPSTRLYAIHGNHDINFHYSMHSHLINRFDRAFNTSTVRLIREKKVTSKGTIRTVNMVSINSMALERDGCNLCNEAEFGLKSIEKKLLQPKKTQKYSSPIVLQHFPTFRTSDANCSDKDSSNNDTYREKYDTLSEEASQFIQQTLKPRSYFSGHSHHYCRILNKAGIPEFTLASFNWRNTNNPSFILAIFTPNDVSTSKCDLPKESTVFVLYIVGTIFSIVFAIVDIKLNTLTNRIRFRKKSAKEIE